jgi:hypothetical protein
MRFLVMLAVSLSIALVSSAAQAGGTPCTPGSFSVNGLEPCTLCEAGTIAPNQGATSCEPCAIGSFAPDAGSSSCASCAPGSYAAQTGTIACTPCEPGHFVDFAAAPACLSCPPGYYADQPGQTSCLLCSAGTFAANDGSSSCEPCAAGRYSEVLGASSCVECSPGTASAEVGATSSGTCTPCPAGLHASNSGATACDACPRNAYAPFAGFAQCLSCGCDDEVACTRDACDTVSGACSAPVVPACQPIEVAFVGTVTSVDAPLATTVQPGDPVEGSFSYDPEAPDATPTDPVYGDYPNAVTGFEVSIGVGSAITASSSSGSVHVVNGGPNGDVISFDTTAADGLTGSGIAALPDGVIALDLLRLADASATALASDALPAVPPNFARFANRLASLQVDSSAAGTAYVDSNDVIGAPEPHAALGIAAALATLVALARRER